MDAFLAAWDLYVTENDVNSSREPVPSGVSQGSVLGPLLFLIYSTDVDKFVASNIRLVADDSVLYSKITQPSDKVALQRDLYSMQN